MKDGGWKWPKWRMYFPFFACEAKCRIGDIDVADKQNAHSMRIAARGIVRLFELAKCQEKLHQGVFAFSISHDGTYVRIYGHYALIKDGTAKFYRYFIRNFDFTSEKEKTNRRLLDSRKAFISEFMLKLRELIFSAMDRIPPKTTSQNLKLSHQILPGDSFGGADLERGST